MRTVKWLVSNPPGASIEGRISYIMTKQQYVPSEFLGGRISQRTSGIGPTCSENSLMMIKSSLNLACFFVASATSGGGGILHRDAIDLICVTSPQNHESLEVWARGAQVLRGRKKKS